MNFESLTLAIDNTYIVKIVDITERMHAKIAYAGKIKDLYDDVDLFEEIKYKEVFRIYPNDSELIIVIKN